jgi:hypothetical protein
MHVAQHESVKLVEVVHAVAWKHIPAIVDGERTNASAADAVISDVVFAVSAVFRKTAKRMEQTAS